MGKAKIEMIGKRFGKLTVIKQIEDHYYPSGRHDLQYECQCDCGNTVNVLGIHLRSGHTISCGCFRVETAKETMTKHDMTDTRLYIIWKNMKSRCYNKKHPRYKDYGARGIKVCNKWKNDFKKFSKWALKHGYDDTLTIDRIDVDGAYRPKNCRWVTYKDQVNNTRKNIKVTLNGETHTLKEWCEKLSLKYKTITNRINKHHWTPIRALTTPIKKKKK